MRANLGAQESCLPVFQATACRQDACAPRQNCLMSRDLLITRASQLVTLAGPPRTRVGPEMRELAIIEDGALLARDGVIVAVGDSSEVEPRADASVLRIDASGS